MGIYDRDYYRGSRGGFLESISSTTKVCKWLIIINVVVFVVQMFSRRPDGVSPFTEFFLLDTRAVLHGQVWRLLTCAFLHSSDIFHILFNMLFLWWFGREVETIYGSREFLTFYLLAAVFSSLAFVASTVVMTLADNVHGPRYALGASGAVVAVVLVCACHFPKRQILLFFLFPVSIWMFLGYFAVRDLLSFFSGGNIAVEAHLGGALFGFLYYRFGWRVSPLFTQFRLPRWRRRRPALRVWRDQERPREPVAVVSQNPVDEQMEAKIDAILAKIKRSGKESLTEQENELLLKASEIYQKRRS